MQSLTRSQFFLNYNFQYVKMSSFVVFRKMTFTQLTPEELTELQSKIQTLESMNMKLFNQKLKLLDKSYPLTLPPWVILGNQVVSNAFILTEITYGLVLFETQKEHRHINKTWSYFSQEITE